MPKPEEVAIVIPAFNEAATIFDIVKRATQQASTVIVIDDGSTDKTAECLAKSSAIVLRNETNRGKAHCLWRGMQYAMELSASAVITLDGDGQHQPEDIPHLLATAQQHPQTIVIAARRRNRHAAPPLRRFANRFADFWISWAAGYRISDSQSGFRLYPSSLLQAIQIDYSNARGFVFESEILITAASLGVHSIPIEVESIYRAGARASHYRPVTDTARIVRMVAGKLLRRGMYPVGLIRVLRTRSKAQNPPG